MKKKKKTLHCRSCSLMVTGAPVSFLMNYLHKFLTTNQIFKSKIILHEYKYKYKYLCCYIHVYRFYV